MLVQSSPGLTLAEGWVVCFSVGFFSLYLEKLDQHLNTLLPSETNLEVITG